MVVRVEMGVVLDQAAAEAYQEAGEPEEMVPAVSSSSSGGSKTSRAQEKG